MERERFERAMDIRRKISDAEQARHWATGGGAIKPEDVDEMRISRLVVQFEKGPDVVIGTRFIGPNVPAIVKSMLAQYDEEIERLEKEFSEL